MFLASTKKAPVARATGAGVRPAAPSPAPRGRWERLYGAGATGMSNIRVTNTAIWPRDTLLAGQ